MLSGGPKRPLCPFMVQFKWLSRFALLQKFCTKHTVTVIDGPVHGIVSPLIVHPTHSVHVNNKHCDCNAYCSWLTISVAIATLSVHG